MEGPRTAEESHKFASPEEELHYLRERIKEKEQELEVVDNAFEKNRLAKREIERYADTPPAEILHETTIIPSYESTRLALGLEEEAHDAQIDALLKIVEERGIRNALAVAQKVKNEHLEDDLHRALVRYVAEGLPVKGAKPSQETWRALNMTLFEIRPSGPEHGEEGVRRPLGETLQSTEQLYAGLLTMVGKDGHISLEIAVPEGTEEAILYIAVPSNKRSLLERQVLSVFPHAQLEEVRGDYNIFNFDGEHAAAYGTFSNNAVMPIKTYGSFEHDPMNVLLSAFAKIAKHGEGVALQLVLGNREDKYNKYYRKILRELEKGESFKQALKVPETTFGEVARDVAGSFFNGSGDNKDDKSVDSEALEAIKEKVGSTIVPVTMRVVASAKDGSRAHEILDNLTATFKQFDNTRGNSIRFKEVGAWQSSKFLRAFMYRTFDINKALPLNLSELTSIFHPTATSISTSRELKQTRAKQAPSPVKMAEDGIVLGVNRYGAARTDVRFAAEDRMRHFYTIGQTGTGKTTLMKNMIIQDIQNGEGVAYIDPHGSDIEDVLAAIPKEREKDLIYFDPANAAYPMGLNVLEYDRDHPELKTLVVDELYDIFRKLYADVPEGFGPMFEQYYRNATMLVVEDPDSGNTLVEISRVLADSAFRKLKLSRCNNPLVVQFWEKIAMQAGGEASLENIVPYITSKFDVFLANDIMRPIVAQEKSAFNLRQAMDGRKIFLANLSKGRIGDRNANLLGLILVGKFLHGALSRADTREALPPFYLYIDEFQNFTTPAISVIFSEARKYRLALNVAHQFIGQLPDDIRDAVFGNVGTRCVFRVGAEDAEFLAKTFEPTFSAADIEHLNNFNAYLSMLVGGEPAPAFNIQTLLPQKGEGTRIDELIALSSKTYGRPRAEVEEEISRKFRSDIGNDPIESHM